MSLIYLDFYYASSCSKRFVFIKLNKTIKMNDYNLGSCCFETFYCLDSMKFLIAINN